MQVGIVAGAVDDPHDLEATLADTSIDCVTGRLHSFTHQSLAALVVRGDAGVQAAFQAGLSAPLLPVETSVGLEPVQRAEIAEALRALANGDASIVNRPILRATLEDGRRLDGVFDIATMTTGPAEISEFELATADRTIGQLRSDGIVVTTPAGSVDYGGAAGGPIVGPTASAMVVIPVSPFLTQEHTWVLGDNSISITVTRDETTVGTFVDDRAAGRLPAGSTVTISHTGSLDTHRVPQSAAPFIRT